MKKDKEQFLRDELDRLETELEKKEEEESNGFFKEDLVSSLRIGKEAVEEVFGPIFIFDEETKKEHCRISVMNVFLAVLNHVCPRQVNYNVVENIDTEEKF